MASPVRRIIHCQPPFLVLFCRNMHPSLPLASSSSSFTDFDLRAGLGSLERPLDHNLRANFRISLPNGDCRASTVATSSENVPTNDHCVAEVPEYPNSIAEISSRTNVVNSIHVSPLPTVDNVDPAADRFRKKMTQVIFYIRSVIQLLQTNDEIPDSLKLDCILMAYIALGTIYAEERTIIDNKPGFNEHSIPWKKLIDIRLHFTHWFSKKQLYSKVTIGQYEYSPSNLLREMEAFYHILAGSHDVEEAIEWRTLDLIHNHLMRVEHWMPVQHYFDHLLLKTREVVQETHRNQSPSFCAAVTKLCIEVGSFLKVNNLIEYTSKWALLRNKLSHLEGDIFGSSDELGPFHPICLDFYNALISKQKSYRRALQYIKYFKSFADRDQMSLINEGKHCIGIDLLDLFEQYFPPPPYVYNEEAFKMFLNSSCSHEVFTKAKKGKWWWLSDELPQLLLTKQFSIDQQDWNGSTLLHYVLLAHDTNLNGVNEKIVNVAGLCFMHNANPCIPDDLGRTPQTILRCMSLGKKLSLFKEI